MSKLTRKKPAPRKPAGVIDMSKIGLKPREMQVLRYAAFAWTHVTNGHYLCSSGQNRAAERLIKRDFLTRAKHQFSPPMPDWIVVVLTPRNRQVLKAAEVRANRAARKP